MTLACVGKLLAIGGVLCLAGAVSPTEQLIPPHLPWVVRHWKWLRHARRDALFATPVTIRPRRLYLGALLSIIGIALS